MGKAYGGCDILDEMHQKGRLGTPKGVAHYAIIEAARHSEFSDTSMLTPLWLGRGIGLAGKRNPLETAREIEERTWKFVSSVLNHKKEQ